MSNKPIPPIKKTSDYAQQTAGPRNAGAENVTPTPNMAKQNLLNISKGKGRNAGRVEPYNANDPRLVPIDINDPAALERAENQTSEPLEPNETDPRLAPPIDDEETALPEVSYPLTPKVRDDEKE